MKWRVTAYWKYEYKEETEEKRKIWKNIRVETTEHAIEMAKLLANLKDERWPSGTKWTAEEEK